MKICFFLCIISSFPTSNWCVCACETPLTEWMYTEKCLEIVFGHHTYTYNNIIWCTVQQRCPLTQNTSSVLCECCLVSYIYTRNKCIIILYLSQFSGFYFFIFTSSCIVHFPVFCPPVFGVFVFYIVRIIRLLFYYFISPYEILRASF